MKKRQRLVVIGNGMVGQRFVEEALTSAPGRFDITIVGKEPVPAYNRILLSPLLAGEIEAVETKLKPTDWYGAQGISLVLGTSAMHIDTAAKQVALGDERTIGYDICVLATGSSPIRLPVPGTDLAGVCTFRVAADVAALRRFAETGAPAVVIGGGLLGIETAYGLARAGIQVTLVHLMDRLMERQVDYEGARLIQAALAEKGIRVVLGAETGEFLGDEDGRVSGIRLADGQYIAARLVVMAVGIRPNTGPAEASGLAVGRGISVDDRLQTSAPDVYAVGECAEHRGACYGLVEPGYEQAHVLAGHLAGSPCTYSGSVVATNLKVSGVPVFSAGTFDDDEQQTIAMHDTGRRAYRRLCLRDGRLVGVVLVGDTADALWYRDLIGSGRSVEGFREALAFGQAYAEAA